MPESKPRAEVPTCWQHKAGGPKCSGQSFSCALNATKDSMIFRIRGLEARQFDHLFALSDAELAEHGAVRQIADGPRPCRISLSDAKPGDELILVNYEHHAVSSPYRMRFAIYIRHGEETFDAIAEVPEQLRKRTLAVRGFDAAGMKTGREIVEGTDLEAAIARQFANVKAQYLHIQFRRGGVLRGARRPRRSKADISGMMSTFPSKADIGASHRM